MKTLSFFTKISSFAAVAQACPKHFRDGFEEFGDTAVLGDSNVLESIDNVVVDISENEIISTR